MNKPRIVNVKDKRRTSDIVITIKQMINDSAEVNLVLTPKEAMSLLTSLAITLGQYIER